MTQGNFSLDDGDEHFIIQILLEQGRMIDFDTKVKDMLELMGLSKKYGAEYLAEAIYRIHSDMKLINDALNDVGCEFDPKV
jgi:hypothetical protein